MESNIVLKEKNPCLLYINNRIRYVFIFVFCIYINNYVTGQSKCDNYSFKFKKGYYHLLNPKGKEVKGVEPFSFAESFSENLSLVERNLRFGYIDCKGNPIIDFNFYDAGSFSSGLAYVSVGGKYGYINTKGELAIAPNFELANDFHGDYALVLKSNPDTLVYGGAKWIYGYINKEGRLIGDSYFSSISYFQKDGEFKASIKKSVFYLSKEGQILREEEKNVKKKSNSDALYYIVEEMPEFPGGDGALRNYIGANVRYPISAQENGIQGRVYVQFVVDQKGNVVDVYAVCNVAPILKKEAVRVVKAMPKWKAGTQEGKPVKVSYIVPINFALE